VLGSARLERPDHAGTNGDRAASAFPDTRELMHGLVWNFEALGQWQARIELGFSRRRNPRSMGEPSELDASLAE
jgi:hypothetical protein